MRKIYLTLFVILFIGSAYLAYLKLEFTNSLPKLNNNKFEVNGAPFTPIVLNYIVSWQTNGKDYWGSPTADYGKLYTNKEEAHNALLSEFELIKELGFNTVRIVGIGEPFIDKELGTLTFRLKINEAKDTLINLDNTTIYKNYFNSINEVLKIASQSGLKVILLTKLSFSHVSSSNFLEKITTRFKNNETILALDLFNEPLYFGVPEKEKKEVYAIVSAWNNIVKSNDVKRLTTIGLVGVREVFMLDPNILPVDFISYHPYEYEPEQVRNEIYWFGKYTKKPWIIGETAIPADNDSIPYEKQAQFAKKTIQQTFYCGGIGYSWWQYKDVEWGFYHANFMGIINRNGETKTSTDKTINGTPKPITNEFKNINIKANSDSCLCLNNYYNYSESDSFRIVGVMIDQKNNPIEGGVVLGWNEDWTHSYHTITKKDGSFELLGSYPFYHWIASATEYTTIRGDLSPDSASIHNKMPTINLGKLKIKKLDLY
ncbi:MAG: cellulase family glycosylhydrolase [Vicingaceae bacterium]|nr:cellulase family glycosylhydrolase [Vicingaceae bacterium]